MGKVYILMLALVVAVGCKSIPQQVVVQTDSGTKQVAVKDLTDEQKVGLLRSEAKKRGIRWEIMCVPKSDYEPEHYQGDAFQPDDKSETSRYAEDGAKDWWAETAPTPAEAAYVLSKSIQSAPNITVDHKSLYVDNPSDCAYNVVLDSKHLNNVPCTKK